MPFFLILLSSIGPFLADSHNIVNDFSPSFWILRNLTIIPLETCRDKAQATEIIRAAFPPNAATSHNSS